VDRNNPAIDPAKTIFAVQPMPAKVQSMFQSSCKDCHSNETYWPWYSHVAPVSWLVAHDVHEGRRSLNLSEWATYSEKRKEHKLEEICEQIVNGDMPDGKYTFIHRDKKLTQEQKDAVCEWTQSLH